MSNSKWGYCCVYYWWTLCVVAWTLYSASSELTKLHGTTCKKCPDKSEHSANLQSSFYSCDNRSIWNNTPGHQSILPNLQSCDDKNCIYTSNCCRLRTHSPAQANSYRSPEDYCTKNIGNLFKTWLANRLVFACRCFNLQSTCHLLPPSS